MPKSDGAGKLAVDGGEPVRRKSFPPRALLGAEEKRAVVGLLDQAIASGEPIGYGGPETQAYERELAEWLGGGHVAAVSSGTSAVLAALAGLGLEPCSEVIVPPLTDPGGIMPVCFLNCVPVIADAHPGSYNAGAAGIEERITERTRAILVAHIGGEPADMEAVLAVAARHGLPVVEDVAQAPGARYKGKLLGSMGTVAAFSTMFGKHFSTGPQGGFVFTRDEALYWRAKRFADRGKPFNIEGDASNVTLGLNLNLNDLAAAIGRVQLRKLPGIIARRQAVAAAVREGLARMDGLSLARTPEGAEPGYWWLRIHVDAARFTADKAAFARTLAAEGIPVEAEYRRLPSEGTWLRERRTFGTSGLPWSSPLYAGERNPSYPCPNAVAAVESHFHIPCHENWGEEEVRDVLGALRKVWGAYARRGARPRDGE